jgi:3-dehydroquinate synthetase
VSAAGAERRVRVEPASSEPYEVRIGAGVAPSFARELPALLGSPPGRLLAVIDAGPPGAWADRTLAPYADAGYAVGRVTITPSEKAKSLETLGVILGAIASARLERRDPVLAIGGGVVGDLAGFAAASYRRGVPVVQIPTTLLSMVDASVGGKTGVNLTLPTGELLKNMAGAFHQPRVVLADPDALKSLPEREFRAGLAECVKHGLIGADWGDPDLFAWMVGATGAILARDPDALVECVARNVAVKARVVGGDERELRDDGGRALLNLGHTFAHAIETLDHLAPAGESPPLLHGEAVGLGLVAASACAASLGLCPAGVPDAVRAAVGACGLPARLTGLPENGVLCARMRHDKKTAGGRLRLILPTELGRARVVSDPPINAVEAGWDAIRAG